MQQLLTSNSLLRAIAGKRPKYRYQFTQFQGEILHCFHAATRAEAYQFLRNYKETVVSWPGYSVVWYRKDGECRAIAIDGKAGDIAMDLLQVDGLQVTLPLLDVMKDILEKGRSAGLVRDSDQWQAVCYDGDNGKFLSGRSIAEVTKLKRWQYWNPEDLERLRQYARDEMSLGSNRWHEFQYYTFDPKAHQDPNIGRHHLIKRVVTNYRLVDNGLGEVFWYCRNKELVFL